MNLFSIFRRRPKPEAPARQRPAIPRYVPVNRPSIDDEIHQKLKAEIAARSHERFADAFDHARRPR